jgi:hypothetical protein
VSRLGQALCVSCNRGFEYVPNVATISPDTGPNALAHIRGTLMEAGSERRILFDDEVIRIAIAVLEPDRPPSSPRLAQGPLGGLGGERSRGWPGGSTAGPRSSSTGPAHHASSAGGCPQGPAGTGRDGSGSSTTSTAWRLRLLQRSCGARSAYAGREGPYIAHQH